MFEHVLCVYPYRRELSAVGFFPPVGLECIATVIEPHTRGLDIVDLRKEAGRTKDFLRPDVDLVCFSLNWDRDGEFLREEIQSVPRKIFTLVGGRHATLDPEHWLTDFPNIDAVVRGDGEEATEELCRGLPLEKIAGLSFRRDGQIFHNPNRKVSPVREDFYPNRRLRRYSYEVVLGHAGTGLLVDLVCSSRGCPFNCTFCSFNRNPWGQKRLWSARSPESVVNELAEIKAPIVGFTDDLFTYDMDRVERICDLILARGIHKNYIINARLEIARRPDILRKMERAGFFLLMLGIESAHDKTLRSMRKGFNTKQIREYCKVLRRTSMILHGYFILGNIGESVEEMEQILPFAKELGLDTIAISVLRASPHSGLDELVAANPGYHIAPSGKIYSDNCSVQELRRLRRRINHKFFGFSRILHLAGKGLQCGQLRLLPDLLLRTPKITWYSIAHARRRAEIHRSNSPSKLLCPIPD
ncbi:MAG: radical SAM protein [Phycisphaerae bacterium]|nr:radical SAM protein [Phycisphaerae bacterium]